MATAALVVTGADALSKAWARHALSAHPRHLVGPLWLRLTYNAGISFSLHGAGSTITTLVTLLVALGVVAVGVRARAGAPAVGFGLLIGGGLANVIDRLAATPHEVTDFVAVGSLPVFNVADAAITGGFATLLALTLRGKRLVRS